MGVGARSAAIPLAFLCKQQENEQLPGVPGCDIGIPGCLASEYKAGNLVQSCQIPLQRT